MANLQKFDNSGPLVDSPCSLSAPRISGPLRCKIHSLYQDWKFFIHKLFIHSLTNKGHVKLCNQRSCEISLDIKKITVKLVRTYHKSHWCFIGICQGTLVNKHKATELVWNLSACAHLSIRITLHSGFFLIFTKN